MDGVVVLGPIYRVGDPIFRYLSDPGVVSKQLRQKKRGGYKKFRLVF
jgi:hypothetical protein